MRGIKVGVTEEIKLFIVSADASSSQHNDEKALYSENRKKGEPMRIQELSLHTRHLDDQKVFYCTTLGLPLLRETADSFTVQIGATRLRFQETQQVQSQTQRYLCRAYPPHLFDRLCRYRTAIPCRLTRRSAVYTARGPSLHTDLRSYHHSRTGRGSRQHAGWTSCLLPDQPRNSRSWHHHRPSGRLSHQFRASQPGSASCFCLWSVLSLDIR